MANKHIDDTLVSCVVVSYNSEATIVETLDSIKQQTYQNIELIVSDDCSADETVNICREWIRQNGSRFVRVELVTTEQNTGVCGNLNRALALCCGEWGKSIAADDKLMPNCVEDFVEYVTNNPEAQWVASYMRKYNETFDEINCVSTKVVDDLSFFNKNAEEQLHEISIRNLINAPSLFKRISFEKSVGYDERYSFEDVPFIVDALEQGEKCYFMAKETVCYRVHQSASNAPKRLFNYKIQLEFRRFREERLFKYLTKRQIRGQKNIWKLQDAIERMGANKNTGVIPFVYFILVRINNMFFNL